MKKSTSKRKGSALAIRLANIMDAIQNAREDIAALRIEVMNALERSNAQVQDGPTAQREQDGPEGEKP